MHSYVHCGTVYKSEDLEPTQMPIGDRLDKEYVWYIHQGILCSRKKERVRALCGDMDDTGDPHSQQTDTGTENHTPRVLTHKRELISENTWTEKVAHHTPWPVAGWEARERGALGQTPKAGGA